MLTKKNDYSMPATNKFSGKDIGKFLKYTVFATNILVIILLLLSVLAWSIMPSKITVIAYLGLVFPIILFINIAYLILWLVFWRWKYALIQVIILACCWQPISTCFPIHFKSKAMPENKIKILSYNVRGLNWLTGDKALKNPILDYVLNNNADIVCFQEFVVSKKKDRKSIISEEDVNKIMKDYPYHSIISIDRKSVV